MLPSRTSRLYLIVQGSERAIGNFRRKAGHQDGDTAPVSPASLQEAFVALFLRCGVEGKLTSNRDMTATYLTQLTRGIAESYGDDFLAC